MSSPVGDNVFELLSRYSVSARLDPLENRLTAGMAAVLDQRPGLVRHVLRAWGVDAPTGSPEVRTQVAIRPGWMDLEIAFRRRGELTGRIWIEAKVHSPLSGSDQIEKYQAALAAHGNAANRLLVLVTAEKRERFRKALNKGMHPLRPEEVVTWQELYAGLERGCGTLRDTPSGWLTQQYLSYLESEGLMPPGKLTKEHIAVLGQVEFAQSALDQVAGEAQKRIALTFRPISAKPYREVGYLEHAFHPGRGWRRTTQFSWGVTGGEVFASVLGSMADGFTSGRGQSSAFVEVAERARLKREAGGAGYAYLTRYEPLDKVVRGRTAADQAGSLARWVVGQFERFQELREESAA